MLEIRNLHKTFGKTEILKGINLKVKKGDVIAIIGPSGSGKTTLLRCMNFLEKGEEGIMVFDNDTYNFSNISKKTISKIRQKTAFVFQNFNLFQNKTALENVIEGLIIARKIPKDKAIQIGMTMLDKVGLSDRYNYYPSQLSGGQKQRVAIARALATNPEVIYFDEPTSALDPELTKEVLNVIKDLADEKMTMIIVTHELNFAKEVATEMIFMADGIIVEKNTTKEFFEKPMIERTISFLQNIYSE